MKAAFEWFTPDGSDVPVEYVRITLPKGDNAVSDEVFCEATPEHKVRFRAAYEEFKKTPSPEVPAVAAEPAPEEDK